MSSVQVLEMILLGLGTGLLSGLFGVGGGVLMVPGLVLLFSRQQHEAQATSLAAMVLLGLVGALRYGLAGRGPDVRTSVVLAVSGMVGTYFLGGALANRLSEKGLQHLFGAFMLLVALHMMGVYQWVGQHLARR